MIGSDVELEYGLKMIEVRDAARALATRLHEIMDHPSYQGVWGLAMTHGWKYDGPTWEEPLKALEEALAKPRVRMDGKTR